MKKVIGNIIRIMLIILLLSTYVLEPMEAYAAVKNTSKATTLKGLRDELSALQAQKAKNQSNVKATQNEINTKNNQIAQAAKNIEKAEQDIEIAKDKIKETESKIDDMKGRSEKLLRYYQELNSGDDYMEYIVGASSVTELIMRKDALDAVIKQNNKSLNEFEDLIVQNEQLQVDLKKKEKQLESNITAYENKISNLQTDLLNLRDVAMDIDDQISTQRELIKYYETLGCTELQNLDECVNQSNNSTWLKPLKQGTISSDWGWRISPITKKSSFHSGLDIAGNSEGTPVYGTGKGVVAAVVNATQKYHSTGKKTCGGNQVYINITIDGQKYTILYAHLLSLGPGIKVGAKVDGQSIIGYQGGGPKTKSWETCSTGTHLHYGVSKGYYVGYNSFMSGQIRPPGFPKKHGKFYSRTQWLK